uniref:Uncharacterized protein n=1 Tax=Setaria italica TaxID=4555 RepID=K3ZCA3_SETIT
MLRLERPVVNGGKDHVKHNGKKSKLTFDELLAKNQKDNEAKCDNWSNDVKPSRLPPKHNFGDWIGKEKGFIQQHHILFLGQQCQFHMLHIPLKLSAQELRKKGMAWVRKGSIQIQNKNNVQPKGAIQLKEKRKFERQSSNIRFAPNH